MYRPLIAAPFIGARERRKRKKYLEAWSGKNWD
jgi:hypothetical protein